MSPREQQIQEAVDAIRQKSTFKPEVGAVLGSGLGFLAKQVDQEIEIPYSEIPHFPTTSVEGHHGALVLGHLQGRPVAFLSGRVHLYEGHDPHDVVFPVRVLHGLGVRSLMLTNAAGGVNTSFRPGDLMLIEDHINFTGTSALLGPNVAAWGPRFPDMTTAYDLEYRELAQQEAKAVDLTLQKGVYAGALGPSYETPAEIRMFRTLGADAVGMSTVHEVTAARHMGMRVLAISCISNMAAGVEEGELSHDEVTAVARTVQEPFGRLVQGLIPKL